MYKYKLVILIFLFQNLFANEFETNCKSCHFSPNQLNMFMNRYTLKYSSEQKIKGAIFDYLKNPQKENSVMPMGFLNRFGLKEAINLDDETLKKSINKYYELYNLKKRIK